LRVAWVSDFPIYFFCDEAFFGVKARELLRLGFRDGSGSLFPLFYEKAPSRWVPQVTLYLYALPVAIFNNSIEVIRITSAITTCLAPIAVGLLLKLGYQSKSWWLSPFVMAGIPTWLLHSRTAFETVQVVVGFSLFLLFYGLYRTGRTWYLLLASVCSILTTYAHFSGLLISTCAALILGIFDRHYHGAHWRWALAAIALGLVLAYPQVQFQLSKPQAAGSQLQAVGSVWYAEGLPLRKRFERVAMQITSAVDPRFWSGEASQKQLPRHVWYDRGHIEAWMWPLALIGLLGFFVSHRGPLLWLTIAAIVSPFAPAVVVEPGIMRVFTFVVPFSLLVVLGVGVVMRWLTTSRLAKPALLGFAMLLSVNSISLLHQALTHGPTWYRDYGLYGMQWGAKQLFVESIPQFLRDYPHARVVISMSWANGGDVFLPFFFENQHDRVTDGSPEPFLTKKRELTEDVFFVAPRSEYERVANHAVIEIVSTPRILYFPDGSPGFYFFNMRYSPEAPELLERARMKRQELVPARVKLGNRTVTVRHSLQDIGSAADIFDSNPESLLRGLEANPFILEIDFRSPVTVGEICLNLAGKSLNVRALGFDQHRQLVFNGYSDSPFDGAVDSNYCIMIQTPAEAVQLLRFEILDLIPEPEPHIHVRGISIIEREDANPLLIGKGS
jgi:hypothetical protein